MLPWWWCLSSA